MRPVSDGTQTVARIHLTFADKSSPDEFLESMKSNLESQTHGLSVFTRGTP